MNYSKNNVQRKSYSRFTANAAKNIVKKKLLDIRRSGARAADELIDQLIKSKDSSRNKGSDGQSFASFDIIARAEIEKDRGKWRNFIIEAAMSFDPDAIACFGVNFIYGGLITSSVGNVGWASLIDLDGSAVNNSIVGANGRQGASSRARAVSETVAKGRSRGNMVWIVKGREAFDPDMLKSYRYEPDIAFILLKEPDKNGKWGASASFEALSGVKNALTIVPDKETAVVNEFDRRGILYAVSSFDNGLGEGNCGGSLSDLSHGNVPRAIEGFIHRPSFPIRADGIIPMFNAIEYLFSEGRSSKIPEYRI